MKDEHSRPKRRTQGLDQRLANDPQLAERVHEIADLRDEMLARGCSLDEIEAKVAEQLRLLGRELLGGMAQFKAQESSRQALQNESAAQRDSKKN